MGELEAYIFEQVSERNHKSREIDDEKYHDYLKDMKWYVSVDTMKPEIQKQWLDSMNIGRAKEVEERDLKQETDM